MALALDASTPALVTNANDPWTTASFTPPNDSLLVVKVMADWFTSGTPLIAVTSTGLTFERIGRIGAASQGLTEIWIARVGSNGGSARTVSATTTIADDSGGIKVEVWTGFNTADPIDGFVCQANNTTNSISPVCVTTTDNAWLTGGGIDWQNLGAATSSDTNEHGEPGGVAILSVRKSAATSPAGSATLNFDAAGTGTPLWTWAIAALRADTADPSPIYKVADRGSAQNLTAETSTAVDLPAAGSITTDNYLIARVALDNTGASGAATTLAVSDARNGSWTVTSAGNADPGAAAAGSTCYIAYVKAANAYTNGDDVTFNYGNSTTAKAIIIEEWFGINKTTPLAVAATTTSGATATGSIARTPTAAGQLVYGALSYEGVAADQITSDPDQTDGSWLLTNQLSTTSGTAASNQTTVGIYKRVTGTSAQTWNVALPASRDWGAVMLVFDAEPAGGGTVNGTALGSFGFAGTASGTRHTTGTAQAAFGFAGTATGTGPGRFVAATAGTGTASYFVDQVGNPILIRGYVLWGLLMNAGRWNGGDWELDLENAVDALAAIGCNVLYTEPLGNTQNGGAFNNGNTHDGVAPFTSTSPVTFNNTFWQRPDYLFDLCAAAGITVFFNWAYSDDLDSAALSGFSSTQFGQYGTELGNRYKTRPNLVWMMGGDYFDTFASQVATVKSAIRATGDTHLFGVQNYPETTSRKDIEDNSTQTTGTNSSEFNFVYSYNAIYWGIEYAWTEASPLPVIWGDGHFDQDTTADRKVMRDLTWWTFSSGGRGMIYGSESTWAWGSSALTNLTSDTFPNTDLGGIWNLFTGFTNWHQLVPDTDSSFVTAGRGTKSDYVTSSGGGGGEYNSSDTQAPYVTAAITADGTLAVVYFPVDQTITVDDTELAAGYTATWVDPISGATSSATIAGTYSPTGNNSLGGPDWLLVFEASATTVTGTATGSFGFTATAAGVDRAVGQALGTFGFTATASGTVGTPPVTGTAAGSFGYTGAASGIPRTPGSAVGQFGFTGTANGVDRAVGVAAGAFGFTATVAGIGRSIGVAAGSFVFTATAAGVPDVHGVAVAAFGFTGTAQGFAGTPPVTGTASGLFGFTATAQGQPRTLGAASTGFGFTATASGRSTVAGVAVVTFGFASAAAGRRSVLGLGQALFVFTATANGQGATLNAQSIAAVLATRGSTSSTTKPHEAAAVVGSGATSTSAVSD